MIIITFENYRRVVRLARERGLLFISHTEEFVAERKDVVWRNDVEFVPEIALEMDHESVLQSRYMTIPKDSY